MLNATNTTTTAATPKQRLNRQAIRFLLDHRLGRLVTENPGTGEPIVTPVRYVSDEQGAFVTHLPAGSPHVAAIQQGGRTRLSVASRHRRMPTAWVDEFGQPSAGSVWHVQAEVEAEIVRTRDDVDRLLSRHVASLADMPLPLDSSDLRPATSHPYAGDLVVLRLQPTGLTTRLRDPAPAPAPGALATA